jgi:FtsP/CotA-like multicopper oxidase with cupredoxin domain
MLINGATEYSFEASPGEVMRLYLTNTANVRRFAFRIPGARMKLVGGDSGRVEREQFVEEVVLAPAERVAVDVL